MKNIKIPDAYIMKILPTIHWSDIAFGLSELFISTSVAIDHAMTYLNHEPIDPLIMELICSEPGDSVIAIVEELATNETYCNATIKDRWLTLVLGWGFERHTEIEDPLGFVEEVYEHFGFPDQIASFVRYMPSEGPFFSDLESNIKNLFSKWELFVKEQQANYFEIEQQ